MQIFFYFFFFTVEELEFSLFVFLCHVPHRERPRSTGNRIYLLRLHPEVFINNILNKSCFPELITKVTKERAQCTVPIRQPLTMLQCYFFIFFLKSYLLHQALCQTQWRVTISECYFTKMKCWTGVVFSSQPIRAGANKHPGLLQSRLNADCTHWNTEYCQMCGFLSSVKGIYDSLHQLHSCRWEAAGVSLLP